MLFDELIKYLKDVEIVVLGLENAYVERYEEEVLAEDRVNLRIRIRFASGLYSLIDYKVTYTSI